MAELPDLPYDYDALEPYIDEETMKLHHGKHHNGYTNKYNKAVEGTDLEGEDPHEVLANLDTVPSNIRTAVRNNGGGYVNHALFWTVMCPAEESGEPGGKLRSAINDEFGTFDDFKDAFSKAAGGVFGSGWAWLTVDDSGSLRIETTPNQDTPISKGRNPIMGLDVWEHSYYLLRQNRRREYIDAWWNVVNWEEVERRFEEAVN